MENNHEHVPEKIWRQIEAMLQINSDNSTQGEVESAALKIQELLIKYNLTMAEVNGKKKGGKRSFNEKNINLQGLQGRHDANWIVKLCNTLAHFNMCKVIHITPDIKYHQGSIALFGESHNLEIVHYLLDYLIPRIEQGCKNAWKQVGEEVSGEKRNTFRRGYLLGCVTGISYKMYKQQEYMQAQNNNCLAMIRVSNQELDEHVNNKFTNNDGKSSLTKPSKNAGKLRKSNLSRDIGFRDGREMEIHKGVEGSNDTKKIGPVK